MSSTVRPLSASEESTIETQLRTIMVDYPPQVYERVKARVVQVIQFLISKQGAAKVDVSASTSNGIRIRQIVAENIDSEGLITYYWWSWGTATQNTALQVVNKDTPENYGYVIFGLQRLQPENLISIVQMKQAADRTEVHDVTSWLNREDGMFFFPEPFSYNENDNINIKVFPHTTGTLVMKILGIEVTLGTLAAKPAI